jgi:hypothetical protein
MLNDKRISLKRWRDAWYWYRNAPHQQDAVNQLYAHIYELPGGACLLHEDAEWFQRFSKRDKLIQDFMHPEGE